MISFDVFDEVRASFLELLNQAKDLKGMEELRVTFFGKKGKVTGLMKMMGKLAPEDRKSFGAMANTLRQDLQTVFDAKVSSLAEKALEARLKSERIDISLPGTGNPIGSFHPLTQTIDDILRVFMGLGYSVAEGPEIEWAKNNFTLLGIPEGHVARGDSDTYYIEDEILLRTQTSPVQVRVMSQTQPPIKIICPGRVYRPDTPDATHSRIFHQMEGLVVDKGIGLADLVGTLSFFAKEIFGEQTKIRLRPHHFPFTEPSCEIDVSCWSCQGKGCPTCKNEGFIEILGAGVVHPQVLENCGIDSEVYSGFAFGVGVERIAMARYGVDDIRNFYENQLSFLRQFD